MRAPRPAAPKAKGRGEGFFDSDNNVDPDNADPDTGDPVTLPFDNELLVVANTVTEGVIFLGFRNP